jgi:carbon-monoxide dehydrogenase medium subunit
MPKIATPQIRTRGTYGGSIAHADPSAELVAVSVALEGRFRLVSQNGERWFSANEFFMGMFTTQIEPEELLVEIAIPPLPHRSGWSLMEVARRPHDFAMVGVAAVVSLDDQDRCLRARIVYLSVGDGPVEAHHASEMLSGETPTPDLIRAAAEKAAAEDVDPGSDIHASAAYRRHLVNILTGRALDQAFQRARNQNG